MSDEASPRSLGHLNPGDDAVAFDRFELGDGLADLVRHVWVVRWSIPDGQKRAQRVLSYPAVNVVVMPHGSGLFGPSPRVQQRVLEGESWAVGVLFRPAAASLLTTTEPRELVRLGRLGEPVPGAPGAAVAAAMRLEAAPARARIVGVLRSWLVPIAAGVDEKGQLLNAVCRLAEHDASILRVGQLADRVGIGMRSLERLVGDRIGVSPKWLIECRRLQGAATRLFAEGGASRSQAETAAEESGGLSDLAAELGYADYAHFSRRYAQVLGETPFQTRRAGHPPFAAADRRDRPRRGDAQRLSAC